MKLVSVKEKLQQEDIKPPEPIVSGLLFRKSLAVVGAPDDSYKTNWALQLAISLAAGIPCYTYSCKKGVVVYLILEGGEDYILERLEEKIAAMELNRDEVLGRIYTSDCSQLPLDDKDVAKDIEETLLAKDPKPDIVIFDPITYALNEDVRFSPKKAELCRNLIWIAEQINGVAMPIIHCRKGTQDNADMDDLLGTSIIADAAATRIKLYRQDGQVNLYAKTRYAERPDKVSLIWRHPLLVVSETTLAPREEAKRAIVQLLLSDPMKEYALGELTRIIAERTEHNEKTVRQALGNLELEGKLAIYRMPKSALKKVKLVDEEEIYAS
jgi:hypothetical protein